MRKRIVPGLKADRLSGRALVSGRTVSGGRSRSRSRGAGVPGGRWRWRWRLCRAASWRSGAGGRWHAMRWRGAGVRVPSGPIERARTRAGGRAGARFDAIGGGSHLRILPPHLTPPLGSPTGLCYDAQMLHTGAGPIPRHTYCYVQPHTFGNPDWLRVAWFGLVSHPGRTWGCHVMLECGAVYRNVPLHRLAHKITGSPWDPADAQTWDCYGIQFSTLEYPFLEGTRMRTRLRSRQEHEGNYLFTAIPMLDGFSLEPEQSKEFYFVKLDNGRFTAQPTNHILVLDKSFITEPTWPKLKRQTDVWSVDNGNEV